MGSELCHICDLFRTALFGPTDGSNEDHLDDGLGNGLPRPMADAPATMGVRSRSRPGAASLTANKAGAPSEAKPTSQHSGGSGATATPSVNSEPVAAARASSGETGAAATAAAAGKPNANSAAVPAAKDVPAEEPAGEVAPPPKPVPKTKFSKRASRGLKSAPAYMSFDDAIVDEDDSDGDLFVEEAQNRRGSGSRSPGTIANQATGKAAYSVNAPSVYRAPNLQPPAASAPSPPNASSKTAATSRDRNASAGSRHPQQYDSRSGGARGDGVEEYDADTSAQSAARTAEMDNMSSRVAMAADSPRDALASGGGFKSGHAGGLRLGGDRVMSIPRDGSILESARPHGQSESFHGYKGYPGYEPDTPVAQQLTRPGRPDVAEPLTINPGADVPDPRKKYAGAAAPTPSSARHPPRGGQQPSDLVPGPSASQQDVELDMNMNSTYTKDLPQQQQQQPQQPVISPSGTMSMDMSMSMQAPEPRSRAGRVEVTTRKQRDANIGSNLGSVGVDVGHGVPAGGLPYGAGQMDNSSAYSGAGQISNHGAPSPSLSQANSMASSFRNIHQLPSEDAMGSVLGTIAGTEDANNEDLQWKRSALKKFHKVMVKGEGLRVVKHNRSGGSQMRIIRYDPEIKALVWNSKRYMKKAGSANVPIIGIKRVGREGNTVSVTAAGRGTIGFEPQRIRDAKILAEALRALVDKEERSAMWRA